MNIELLYTSAPQGLKQGSRGFCTVISTTGLPINLAQRLESLSGYRHLYQPGDSRADANPVCHSHLRFSVGGRTVSVISRVAAYGVDYSQRTNKIAHHISIDDPLPRCGPAAVLTQPGFMRTDWDSQCKTLSVGPVVPNIALSPAVCVEWQRMTGDAGWAGVIANAWSQPTGKPVWIIFSESQSSNLLSMMVEATALLPDNRRWQATFSTYCTNLPPDVDCRVRCVVSGSEEARMAIVRGLVIDLTKPMPQAVDSPATQAARTGHAVGLETARLATPPTEPVVIPGKEIDSEAQYEVAGASLEPEYQVEGLSSIPPALFPLQSNKKRWQRKNSATTATPPLIAYNWKFPAVIGVGVLVLLLGLGAVYVWVCSFGDLVATVSNSKKQKVSDKDPIVNEAKSKEPVASNLDTPPEVLVKSANNNADSQPSIEIFLVDTKNNTITSPIELNESVLKKEFPIAKVQLIGVEGDVSKVFIDGDDAKKYIRNDNGTLRWIGEDEFPLKQTKNQFDFQVKYEDDKAKLSVKVTLTIINTDDPDIELRIVDAKSILREAFVAGTTLVVTETKDPDETTIADRKWSWESAELGTESWTTIPSQESVTYTVRTDDYSRRIRCKLRYSSSTPGPTTEVVSHEVSCYPRSTLTVKYDELIKKPVEKIFGTLVAACPVSNERLRNDTSYTFLKLKGVKVEQKLEFRNNIPIDQLKSVEGLLKAWKSHVENAEREIEGTIEELNKVLIFSFKQVGLHSDTDVAMSFLTRLQKTSAVDFIEHSEPLNQLLVDIENLARLLEPKKKLDKAMKKAKEDLEAGLLQNATNYPVLLGPVRASASNSGSRLEELDRFRKVIMNGKMMNGIRIADTWTNLVRSRNTLCEAMVRPITYTDVSEQTRRIEVAVSIAGTLAASTAKVPPLLSYPIIFDLVIDSEKSLKDFASSHQNLTAPEWFTPSVQN